MSGRQVRRVGALALALAVTATLVPSAAAQGDPSPAGAEVEELRASAAGEGTVEIMVSVDPAAGDPGAVVDQSLEGRNHVITRVIDDIVALEVDADGLESLVSDPRITSLVEDARLTLSPLADGWSHPIPSIGAGEAHAAGFDGRGTRIAIVDAGVDLSHPALAGSADAALAACFVTGSTVDPCPDDGDADPNTSYGVGAAAPCAGALCFSGTVMASLALGRGSPGVPKGVAPAATLIPIRVYQTDDDGNVFAQTSDLVAALHYLDDLAAVEPVDVISLPVNDTTPFQKGTCHAASALPITSLMEKRSVVVGATGEGGSAYGVSFPTCHNFVLGVTASGPHDLIQDWANIGGVNLAAPAFGTAATPGGSGDFGGTSVAAARVVGAVALLLQQDPDLLVGSVNQDQGAIINAFRSGAVPTWPIEPTWGRIDIAASLGVRERGTYGLYVVRRSGNVDTLGRAPRATGVGHHVIVGGAVARGAGGPTRQGYWLVDTAGQVWAQEGAQHHGDMSGIPLNQPVVAMAATPSGDGYWLLAEDGGIFSFGDAQFYGSTGSMRLNAPVTDIATSPTGRGYWLTAKDGGVFSFGDAQFFGSTGGRSINQPVVSMAATSSGRGYWLVALDGGVFSFGDAQFYGSLPGAGITNETGYRVRATPDGLGYYIATLEGGIYPFGMATFFGHAEWLAFDPVMELVLVSGS